MATKLRPLLAALLILATAAFSSSGCIPWAEDEKEIFEDEEDDDDDEY
jgi:hypothetical protein